LRKRLAAARLVFNLGMIDSSLRLCSPGHRRVPLAGRQPFAGGSPEALLKRL
jgi:hypothetical protein